MGKTFVVGAVLRFFAKAQNDIIRDMPFDRLRANGKRSIWGVMTL